MEIWKDIPGYEGLYQASSEGNVRSIDRVIQTKRGSRRYRGKLLVPAQYCKTGHVSVVLGKAGVGQPVHRLVAITFMGPPSEHKEVRHKNGNPKDNRLLNLEYGTRTENILDVFALGRAWRKLTAEDAMCIRNRLSRGELGSSLAREYGVSQSAISAIKNRKTFWWIGDKG